MYTMRHPYGSPGGMSAEVIGCPEARVHRPFDDWIGTVRPRAVAVIIIGDAGPRPQTVAPQRTFGSNPHMGDRRVRST
ncbi:hypothetical protein GCM10023238_30860 [Streptomyces heliomycini]